MALTERQDKILNVIQNYVNDHGRPPTIREIGEKVGISSTSVVNYHLNKLKAKGLLNRSEQVSRGLKLNHMGIPILGTIAAGQPIPVFNTVAASEVDDDNRLDVTRDIVPRDSELFALRVKGLSMIDALVNDGDIVIMEPVQSAENGEMVAAWIKDREETTLKRFYRENGRIRLQPANPTMDPIFLDPSNVEVQGRVVTIIRNLN